MGSKSHVGIVASVVLACSLFGQNTSNLHNRFTNQEIIGMVQAGVAEDVIVAKLRSVSNSAPDSLNLDTSADGIKALKLANVPDSLIRVVIDPQLRSSTNSSGSTASDNSSNLPPAEVGIYWRNASGFILIEGQAISQTKVGGKTGSFFSYGMRGVHWDAFLNGPTSKNVIRDSQPVFYIYVPDGASSSDFVLLKLNKKSDRREFQIGSFGGMLGGHAGVKREKEIPFKAEHVGIRTYRIILDRNLDPGEYAFFMGTGTQTSSFTKGSAGGSGAGGAATGRVYDFNLPG